MSTASVTCCQGRGVVMCSKRMLTLLLWFSLYGVSNGYEIAADVVHHIYGKPLYLDFDPDGPGVIAAVYTHSPEETLQRVFIYRLDDKTTAIYKLGDVRSVSAQGDGISYKVFITALDFEGKGSYSLYLARPFVDTKILEYAFGLVTEGLITYFEKSTKLFFYGTKHEAKCMRDKFVQPILGLSPFMWKFLSNSEKDIYISQGKDRQLAVLTHKEMELPLWQPLLINNAFKINDMVLNNNTVYIASDLGIFVVTHEYKVKRYFRDKKFLMLVVYPSGTDVIAVERNKALQLELTDPPHQDVLFGFDDSEEFEEGQYFVGLAINKEGSVYFGTNETAVYVMPELGKLPMRDPVHYTNQEINGMVYDPKFGVMICMEELHLYLNITVRVTYSGVAIPGDKIMAVGGGRFVVAGWNGLYTGNKTQ